MNKARQLIEKLKTPDREFSPIPFWFINDELRDEEIVRQLTDFNQKGVNGVVIHPRIGIPESIQYLSDEYMHFVTTAVETAARLDMKVVLYDEAMYPSGSAHGLVAKADPRFASQCIILADSDGEGKVIAKTYKATVHCTDTDNIWLAISGEEMAECFVNGSFAGFSLWNTHEFCLSPHLKEGDNVLEIKMTGSAVNRFTDYTIDYGISID